MACPLDVSSVKQANFSHEILSSVEELFEELEPYDVKPTSQLYDRKSELDADKMAHLLKAVVSATFSLLQHLRRTVYEHEKADERKQRLIDDGNALRVEKEYLKQQIAEREKSNKAIMEEERRLKEKYEATCRAMKTDKEEIRRLKNQLKHKEELFNREMRKKDQRLTRLEGQLSQALRTGSLRKPVKMPPTEEEMKLEKLNEAKEDAYKRVISEFENNNESLMKENLTLTSILYRLTADLALMVDDYNGLMRVCFKKTGSHGDGKDDAGEPVQHSSKDPSELSVKECKSQIHKYIQRLNDIFDLLKDKLAYGENNSICCHHVCSNSLTK